MFGQIARIGRDVPALGNGGKKILFFSTRQERDQVTVTTVLGQALVLRGHEVTALHCDRVLAESCNSGVYPRLTAERCEACYIFTRRARAGSGMRTLWLSAYAHPGDWEDATSQVAELTADSYASFEAEGLPIGELVRHSVAHFLRTDEITMDAAAVQVYRNWLIGGVVMARACRRLLDVVRPEVIVMLSGYFMPERICFEIARARGIRCVMYESGAESESYVFDHDRPIDYDLPADWQNASRVPLSDAQRRAVWQRMDERRRGSSLLVNYWPKGSATEDVRGRLGIAPSQRIAALFTNLTWDSAVFEHDVFFNGLADWVLRTIELFRQIPDTRLVIRAHPAEHVLENANRDPIRERVRRAFGGIPDHISFVDGDDPISSYAVMDAAAFGIVYTSTMGVEMATVGKPVVVAGRAHFRGKGFTRDPSSIDDYGGLLRELSRGDRSMTEQERELALRYAYFFLFTMGRKLFYLREERGYDMPSLRTDRAADLRSGHDVTLDRVCEAIACGGSFIGPRP